MALVTARILDTFYPAQDNRNNNMLKSFSFGDYSNQREKVLKYNETVAIKRINNYFEKQKNLQAPGWNPTKTAELLSGRDTYNVGGIVLRKVMQLKAAGKDVEYDPSAAQKTQIATTGGTYEKASKIMDDYNAYDSLDYGSGIQINQARQVLKADTYEPYPQLDKANKYGTPDFVEPEEITRKYNFITNFSVLNVLPKLDRDKAVKHIGSLLQDNGVAVITVRSKDDVLKALPNAKKQLSDSELITARGTYQKGFTRDELKKYLSETLGKGYEVMDLPNKYKMSGVGVLIKKSSRSKFSEGGKVSTNEQMDRLGFEKGGNESHARMQEINTYLKGKGYSKEARAGILANISVETGTTYDPRQLQDGGKGYGLFQLDAKREDYNNWMAERNFKEDKINNMAAQLEYMHDTIQTGREIGGTNAKTLQKSFNEKSAEEVALDFSNIWERPNPEKAHNDWRVERATTIYNTID